MFQLRPFQKEALEALENNSGLPRHVVCIAPTGSGKSLIYEKAAAAQNRKTILITPLVALARQQYRKLRTLGIPTYLGAGGSKQTPRENESGAWIISPEVLQFAARRQFIQKWKPNFLVVDECHCLWEWGEDFRPAFQFIPDLFRVKSISKSLWLTATLPDDARNQLRTLLPFPPIEIGHFELPAMLHLNIKQIPLSDRLMALVQWLSIQSGAGIVFVATREATLRIARVIEALGKKVLVYHGGMSREERQNAEEQVRLQLPDVIVATSAFGMGMDYAHLTFVVLWQVPTSILTLVQTIGRVGRGENTVGHSLVFWDFEDFKMLEWTVQNSTRKRRELISLLEFLSSKKCRRKSLRSYFDSILIDIPCGLCDRCSTNKNENLLLA